MRKTAACLICAGIGILSISATTANQEKKSAWKSSHPLVKTIPSVTVKYDGQSPKLIAQQSRKAFAQAVTAYQLTSYVNAVNAAAAAAAAQAAQQTTGPSSPSTTTTNPPATSSGSSDPIWSCIIQHESGGNPQAVNSSSGAGGLFQFLPSTWQANGGSGLPENASVGEQWAIALATQARDGWSPWRGDGCTPIG